MGAVWIAEHLTLNTKVAVKFISEERLDPNDSEVLERFVREASAAAQIKSSHVVQTFDQGVMKDGTPYIVMELLEGEELGERLQREKKLPLREAVKIIGQTAKALQMAHKIGVVHRAHQARQHLPQPPRRRAAGEGVRLRHRQDSATPAFATTRKWSCRPN